MQRVSISNLEISPRMGPFLRFRAKLWVDGKDTECVVSGDGRTDAVKIGGRMSAEHSATLDDEIAQWLENEGQKWFDSTRPDTEVDAEGAFFRSLASEEEDRKAVQRLVEVMGAGAVIKTFSQKEIVAGRIYYRKVQLVGLGSLPTEDQIEDILKPMKAEKWEVLYPDPGGEDVS